MATAYSYSSFFASGLLAPPVSIHTRKHHHGVNDDDSNMLDASPVWKAGGRGLSPAVPSSPMAVPDNCDIEAEFVDARATTPTPVASRSRAFSDASTISTDSEGMSMSMSNRLSPPDFSTANVMFVSAGADVVTPTTTYEVGSPSPSPSQPLSARKLRRRRSSLAGAASPKSAIKSPSRSAGHALELQKHLMGSPSRARSSSVSLAAAAADMMMTGAVGGSSSNIFIPEQNTFIGRLRSGSISSLRRKPLRRASMQPPAPPPTAPLPALPPSLLNTPNFGFLEPLNRMSLGTKSAGMDDLSTAPGMFRKNRDRSYSINAYDRIDEEMKES